MDENAVLALIDRIYQSPGDAAAWQRTTTALAAAFNAEHSHLVVFDRIGAIHCDFVTLADAGDEYARHYAALDTAVHRLMRGPDRKPVTQLDVMSPDELKACPVQQEMLPKYGVQHRLWEGPVAPGGGKSSFQRLYDPNARASTTTPNATSLD